MYFNRLVFYIIVLQTTARCEIFDDYLNEFDKKIKSWPFLSLSPKCKDFYTYLNFSDETYRNLVLTFLDSSTKIPTGLISGSLVDVGHFDECYQTKTPFKTEVLYGKYCIGASGFNLTNDNFQNLPRRYSEGKPTKELRFLVGTTGTPNLFFAYCTPSFCTAEDVQQITELFLPFLSLTFDEALCSSKDTEPELSTGFFITILILGLLTLVVLVSSLYEGVLYYSGKKPSNGILLAFSVLQNGRNLFKSSDNPEQLLCLSGIKAISMMWVILAHEYVVSVTGATINLLDVISEVTAEKNMWLINAHLSVDSFLTVGGLVTMYTFLRNMNKGAKFNIFLYYIHRYLRLTPVLAVVILIHLNVISYLGNGPFWNNIQTTLVNYCEDYWWSCLLYIQNIVNPTTSCVGQTWYLSVDMQLFILSPIVLLVYNYQKKLGKRMLEFLMIMGILSPFAVSYSKELNALIPEVTQLTQLDDYMRFYYYQTHARFGPYVIGMYFGAIIYDIKKNRTKFKINSVRTIIAIISFWCVALIGLVASLYGGAEILSRGYDHLGDAMFNALDKNAWALSLCILIVLCELGVGGPVNWFLSLPIFQFLSKLCYTMYLLHAMVIVVRWAAMKTPVKFSHLFVMHQFWADFMVTLGLAVIFCLMFESPVIIIEKHAFGKFGKLKDSRERQGQEIA